jgi:hypothetical protein
MSRRWLLLGPFIGLLVAVLVVAMLSLFWPRVTLCNYERIEKGMTRHQVERFLGKPTTMGWKRPPIPGDDLVPNPNVWIWRGREARITVVFSADRVDKKDCSLHLEDGYLDYFYRMLTGQWAGD